MYNSSAVFLVFNWIITKLSCHIRCIWIHWSFHTRLEQILLVEKLMKNRRSYVACRSFLICESAGCVYLSPVSNHAACRWLCQLTVLWMCPTGLASLILPLLETVSVHRWLSTNRRKLNMANTKLDLHWTFASYMYTLICIHQTTR